MSEQGNLIEQEIAELSAAIEAKRVLLEREHGIVPEAKEVLHRVVGEKIFGVPSVTPGAIPVRAITTYLDDLDPDTTNKINDLIDLLPKHGLHKTIEMAKNFPAHILDAFHDALVDKLHAELVKAKLI
ncbi:MAG TPA: hypothetical protein VJI73_04230 [Candidatus Paceibacterota bacterium]